MQVSFNVEELIIAKRSLRKIADIFGLQEADLINPNCGDWIVDQIKQLQQTALLVKSLQKQLSDNGSVEGYNNLNNKIALPNEEKV